MVPILMFVDTIKNHFLKWEFNSVYVSSFYFVKLNINIIESEWFSLIINYVVCVSGSMLKANAEELAQKMGNE